MSMQIMAVAFTKVQQLLEIRSLVCKIVRIVITILCSILYSQQIFKCLKRVQYFALEHMKLRLHTAAIIIFFKKTRTERTFNVSLETDNPTVYLDLVVVQIHDKTY